MAIFTHSTIPSLSGFGALLFRETKVGVGTGVKLQPREELHRETPKSKALLDDGTVTLDIGEEKKTQLEKLLDQPPPEAPTVPFPWLPVGLAAGGALALLVLVLTRKKR